MLQMAMCLFENHNTKGPYADDDNNNNDDDNADCGSLV